ncbi:MAG TPA: aminotransferase class V-fold PLP-dependent enzyme [Steroidobacteraceae bacterium]|nr:aminotransferase class V-fold PLP-dependent enzyme [Steroidobacteraceae bacterium]
MIDESDARRQLRLSDADLQELAERLRKFIVDWHQGVREAPVGRMGTRADLEPRLAADFPSSGRPVDEVWQKVVEVFLPHTFRLDHPRFFAFVPGPNNFVSVVADAIASACNIFAGSWIGGSGPSQLETNTIRWLCDALGFPPGAGGHFLSGGSHASLTALMVARDEKLPGDFAGGTAYCSDQTHASVVRAFRILGIGGANVRILESDDRYRLPVAHLRERIAADRAQGLKPFCVVATAGTTSTGAVDPIPEIAALCAKESLWCHIDGAYGGAAALEVGELRRQVCLADSLAIDPHKWLFQPLEIGCVLLRDGALLPKHFTMHADYFDNLGEGRSYLEEGMQLTRSARALKLWMSLQVFGVDAFRAAIARGIELAQYVEQQIRRGAAFEIVTPAELGIVTFRVRGRIDSGDALLKVCTALRESGFAMLSTTKLRGEQVLRMCTINPRTTDDDIDQTLARIEGLTR